MAFMDDIENKAGKTVEDIFQYSGELMRKSVFDVNRKNFSGFMWVAALDYKTCLQCASLDGKIWTDSPEAGVERVFPEGAETIVEGSPPRQPLHANCRCVMVPVLKGMEDDYSGAPNYAGWLSRRNDTELLDILGPSRFQLYKQGFTIDRFVKDGKTITLEELGVKRIARKTVSDLDGKMWGDAPDMKPSEPVQTPPTRAIINMGNLEKSLGKEFVGEMEKRLQGAPPEIQKAWNNVIGDLKVVDAHYKGGAYYSLAKKGIFFNAVADSKVHTSINGLGDIEPAYSKVFHELFHNMSAAAANKAGHTWYADFADVFESTKYTGMTLSDMLKSEANSKINSILALLKADAVQAGQKAGSVTKPDAYRAMAKELKAAKLWGIADVSDMWEGSTKGKVISNFSHVKQKKTYWEDNSVGSEAFAEMGMATVNHPASLEKIKEYFPKSYEIFLEMIDEIGGLK